MDKRLYSRIIVDAEGSCFTDMEICGTREITGVVKNISEQGIQMRVDLNKYPDAEKYFVKDTAFKFQFADIYNICDQERLDILTGKAKVRWSEVQNNILIIGCIIVDTSDNYQKYVMFKTTSKFLHH